MGDRSRIGGRPRWEDDPAKRRKYLRIYREVRVDGLSVGTVVRDHGISRAHVYRIIEAVEKARTELVGSIS